jgi:hypothetical protein
MAVLNPPEPQARWRVLARWLAGASALIYICSRFVPSAPPAFRDDIEDSYLHYFHTAFAKHLQFGRDVVYPFGPWGLLYGGYDPATYWVTVLAWLGLSVVFWWIAWKVARVLLNNDLAAWIWLMAFALVAGLPVFTLVDARLTAFIVLLWLSHFFTNDRSVMPAQVALVVALGLLSLSKANVLAETGSILAIITLDGLLRRRGLWMLPCFLASLLVFWVAARQELRLFGPFIHSLRQHMSGYTEATMMTGPDPMLNAGCFLVVAGLVCAMGAYAIWLRDRLLGLFPLAVLGLLLFTAFKHGYVRHDFHEAAGALDLLLIAMAVWAVAWPVVLSGRASVLASPNSSGIGGNQGSRGRSPSQVRSFAIVASFVPALLILVFATVTFARYYETSLPVQLAWTFSPRSLLAPARALLDPSYLRTGYEAYLSDIRNENPFPPIQGPVDHYPGNGIALQARNLDYRPRPVMHSCAAYTPELAQLNAAYLGTTRAADTILFQIIPIDGRFPSLEDGLSWPELLTRYDVREVQWPFVLMKRAEAPRSFRLEPLGETALRFGEKVLVPSTSNGPVWATFEISRTLAGTLASTLYKPPILWISVTTHDGKLLRFRLIPGMAASGFVLSPVIPNCWAFAELARSGGLCELDDKQVQSACLTADTDTGTTACYGSPVHAHFYRLEYPGQDLDKLAGFRELNSIANMASRARVLQGDFPPSWDYLPTCGSVLRVAPNSAIQWSVPGHAKGLNLAFGVTATPAMASSSSRLQPSSPAGIVFRLSAVDAHGARVPLWSQRLDVTNEPATPNRQQALVELAKAPSCELVLETSLVGATPRNDLACYWAAVEAE